MATNNGLPVGITNLPPEMIELIASFMYIKELAPFRRSCKYICDSSFTSFRSSNFQSVTTDLSVNSLARIEKIAGDGRFAGYVEEMVVDMQNLAENTRGFEWIQEFFASGDHPQVQQLRRTLQSWHRCRSFRLNRRQKENDKCPEYTLGVVICMIDFLVHDLQRYVKEYTLVDLSGWDLELEPDHKTLTVPGRRGPVWANLWSSVESLRIECRAEGDSFTGEFGMLALYQTFQSRALRRLSLNLCHGDAASFMVNWAISTRLDCQLEQLDLWGAHQIDSKSLRDFLHQHRQSLRRLSLKELRVEAGGWRTTLDLMADELGDLQSVALSDLTETSLPLAKYVDWATLIGNDIIDQQTRSTIQFYLDDTGLFPRVVLEVDYEGPRMDVALRKLACLCTVSSPLDWW